MRRSMLQLEAEVSHQLRAEGDDDEGASESGDVEGGGGEPTTLEPFAKPGRTWDDETEIGGLGSRIHPIISPVVSGPPYPSLTS